MKTKKFISLLIVSILIIAMLCTVLVACKDKNKNNETENTDNGEVIPTDLDVDEVKEAVAPFMKNLCLMVAGKGYYGEMLYCDLMNGNDEYWEFYVGAMEQSGISIDNIRYCAENASPLFDKIIYLTETDEDVGQAMLKETFDLEYVSKVLEVSKYIASNLRTEQAVIFASCLIDATRIVNSWTSDFEVELNEEHRTDSIAQLFKDAGYYEEFEQAFIGGVSFEFNAGNVINQVGKNAGIANELVRTLLTFNGLSASELKEVVDFVLDVIGRSSSNDYGETAFSATIADMTAAQLKSVFSAVGKIVEGIGEEQFVAQLRSFAESVIDVINIADMYYVRYVVDIYMDIFSGALPYVSDVLTGIKESDLQALIDIMVELESGDYQGEADSARNMFKLLKVIDSSLSGVPKEAVQSAARLFGVDYNALCEVVSKYKNSMTDDEVFQLADEVEEKMYDESLFDNVYFTSQYVETGTSPEEVFSVINNYYGGILPQDAGTPVVTCDTSASGYVAANIRYGSTADGSDDTEYVFYVRVYDDNFKNELIYPQEKLQSVPIVKGKSLTQTELVALVNNYIYFNGYAFDPVALFDYYVGNKTLEDVTPVDTSVSGIVAAVATYTDGIRIPFVYNVIDAEKEIVDIRPAYTAVAKGSYPIITEYTYRFNESKGDYDCSSERQLNDGEYELIGFDPDKTGAQAVSVKYKGETTKISVYVYTNEEVTDYVWVDISTQQVYLSSAADKDNAALSGNYYLFGERYTFNTYGEFRRAMEGLGFTVSWDLTEMAVLGTTISVKDSAGNEIFETWVNVVIAN